MADERPRGEEQKIAKKDRKQTEGSSLGGSNAALKLSLFLTDEPRTCLLIAVNQGRAGPVAGITDWVWLHTCPRA